MYVGRYSPYGVPVDVWAMGCVVYIMLCGWHPFQNQDNTKQQRSNIMYDNLSALREEKISFHAKDFIQKMLIKDPSQRWTIPQILKHPWLEDAASDNHLLKAQHDKLKKFQHLRRLRKVSFAVLAATRAAKLGITRRSSLEPYDEEGDKGAAR